MRRGVAKEVQEELEKLYQISSQLGNLTFFKDMEKNFRFAIREKMLPLKKLVTTYVNIQPVFFGGNKIKSEVGCPMLF